MPQNFFKEKDFQEQLLAFVCRDINFLKECGSMLSADDFKPAAGEPRYRWVIAETALRYWQRFHQPIRKMLRSDLIEFARTTRMGDKESTALLNCARALYQISLVAVDALTERVSNYKQEVMRTQALEELIELHGSGQLTNDKWQEISKNAIDPFVLNKLPVASEYFNEVGLRNDRRSVVDESAYPLLYIKPLDDNIKAISYGHLGMLMAPLKRGKSLGLLWIATAYALQKLNVLYITLEDIGIDVEDRFDANITGLTVRSLKDLPNKVLRKFANYRRLVRGRLRLVDGSGSKLSVGDIEEIYLRERNMGFAADAIIIDYDNWIRPTTKRQDRRLELSDIYTDLRNFIGRYKVIGWTAAQTQRSTKHLKVITSDMVAEDISKVQKVALALSIGAGEWGDNSAYIYVAAHRHDKGDQGWNIMQDKSRMHFFDLEATEQMTVQEALNGGSIDMVDPSLRYADV